ncbi:MAG TPA: protein kinase [Polyangia bacterium]
MARNPAGEADSAAAGESDEAFVPLPLATDLSAGTTVGEYTIDCKLGDGGMATVYGATHPLIGKKAAIKVMNPALSLDAGLVERFVLEARAVNAIGHPNIVDVFSFGRLGDGRSYFVMEWLQGETLYDRLWERKPTLDEALDIVDQVCDALEAAHEKGIVHRDLKPANVFLCPVRGRRDLVKLLDFGVAKLIATAEGLDGSDPMSRPPQTMTGQVVGTPDYISPEQARAKPVDGKTDVYALGVIAYEMILGRRPFEADNSADVVRMHLGDAPPAPRTLWPEIPSTLDELLLRMLHKSAAKRPTPAEVRAAIHELRGTPPPFDWDSMAPSPGRLVEPASSSAPGAATPSASQPGAPHAPRSTLDVDPLPAPGRRRTLWIALGLAAVGCGAAMLTALPWRTSPAQPERPTIGQPLSHSETASSRAKTELPAPTAPAVDDEGTLVVRVDAANARIELDGQLIAQSASGARLRVEPGEHALAVTAPGRRRYSGRVAVATGATIEVPIRLHRDSEPAPPAVTTAAAPKPEPKKPAPKRNDPDYLVDPFSGTK